MTTINYAHDNGLYGTGDDDNYSFVFFGVLLVCLRHFLVLFVFNPLADLFYAKEVAKKKEQPNEADKLTKRGKFMRNGWQFFYYTIAWTWGFVEYYNSAYFLDMDKMWHQYPQNEHTLSFKLYYLVQGSFWAQMIVITMLDTWQNDHIQMMTHHVLTTFLVTTSYNFNFTRIGHVILVEQDFADIFLPLAKMIRYANLQPFDDVVFALFAVAWIPTRHGMFFWILSSLFFDAIRIGTEQGTMGWAPGEGKYFTENIIHIYMGLLSLFQCILLVWLKDLLIAVAGALMGKELEDVHESTKDTAATETLKPKAD